MRARPIRTSSARKIASDTSWSAVVFAAAEKNSDNSRMGITSASAAAVMTSWPNSVVASPVSSNSIGSSSPADVDIKIIASRNGWCACPASQKNKAHNTPSAAETPNATPASRDSGLRSRSTSISSPARNSSMPRPSSRGSRPSATGTRTEIPAMIRTLLNDKTSRRFPPDTYGNPRSPQGIA